jgi:urease accessory protein
MRLTFADSAQAPRHALTQPDSASHTPGWRAHLKLRYIARDRKTVLLEQQHTGPLFVQKPFYPEGKQTCHTYLVHPPGGVVGGDTLGLDVTVESRGHVVVTTPAAGKFYRSAGPQASQVNQLAIAADAALEWLPQETILYDQANAMMRTTVRLDKGARFIGWEMICLGLPASKQPFTRGLLAQRFEIFRENQPLFIDPFRVRENDPVLTARWGLGGRPAIGTMVATTGDNALLCSIRKKTEQKHATDEFAATQINDLTICRFLGNDVYSGLRYFLDAWRILRPAVLKRPVCLPRIWAT